MPRPNPADVRASLRADLAARIRAIEGHVAPEAGRSLPLGLAAIDDALPGGAGLPLGSVHEVSGDLAAATGFIAALCGRLAGAEGRRRPVLWVLKGVDRGVSDLYPPGLTGFGLGLGDLLVVTADSDRDALWVMEEALRCPGLAAVVSEVEAVELVETRRLQLAVETLPAAARPTGFLLLRTARPALVGLPRRPDAVPSAALTRWWLTPRPSTPVLLPDGAPEPGVGDAAWDLSLTRARGGRPGAWPVVWRGDGHILELIEDRDMPERQAVPTAA